MISVPQIPYHHHRATTLNCRGRILDLSSPKIMGILNITPDSFSDGGRYNTTDSALFHAEKMIKEGATIIDIGAQSTRPNAEKITAQQEIIRLGNIILTIKQNFPEIFVSIDTFYGDVVSYCFDQGVDLVNDISAGMFDDSMLNAVARTQLPYILMHNNETYATMHDKIINEDIIIKINRFFSEKIIDLKNLGINDLVLDPGFGFGKTIPQQEQMIEEAQHFGFGDLPVLIGISRKSFIYKPLNKQPQQIAKETSLLHEKVLQKGAQILRVHDVADAQKLLDKLYGRY